MQFYEEPLITVTVDIVSSGGKSGVDGQRVVRSRNFLGIRTGVVHPGTVKTPHFERMKSFEGPVLKCRGSRKHLFFRISTGARSYDLRNFGARTFNLDTNNVVKFRFSGGQTRTTEATVPTELTILFFVGAGVPIKLGGHCFQGCSCFWPYRITSDVVRSATVA